MVVRLKLYALLGKYLPAGAENNEVDLELPDGATPEDQDGRSRRSCETVWSRRRGGSERLTPAGFSGELADDCFVEGGAENDLGNLHEFLGRVGLIDVAGTENDSGDAGAAQS